VRTVPRRLALVAGLVVLWSITLTVYIWSLLSAYLPWPDEWVDAALGVIWWTMLPVSAALAAAVWPLWGRRVVTFPTAATVDDVVFDDA